MVERLISSPTENLSRFEQKLSDLRQPNRFYDWRSVRSFARELTHMLDDLRAARPDPREGVRQVAALYESDEFIFNSGDDSNGDLGDIFRYDAVEVFCEFAARCQDRDWVIETVLKLNEDDQYGVRDSLVEAADRYLSPSDLRKMADRCIERAEQGGADWDPDQWWRLVALLAAQLKDAQLFEKVRSRGAEATSPAACLDIARVHLEAGDAAKALEWAERVPKEDSYIALERDDLLLEIQKKLGNKTAQEEIAWRSFTRFRSKSAFETLLDIIGPKKRDSVIMQSLAEIKEATALNNFDVMFMIEVGRLDDAEEYLMLRKDQLNGDLYSSLLRFAEAMESDKRYYAASIIYRELTNSILARGISKYYYHGVRYLKKLDQLASMISDWRGDTDHAAYFAAVKQEHFRKKAFWSQYTGA